MKSLPPILMIEDNQDDYEAATRSFKINKLANPVHWFKNGSDALDYLCNKGVYQNETARQNPSLILLDLNMPGIDGIQILQKIKNDPHLKMIPVIILTTSSDMKDIEQCYRLGASTYIQKPISFEGLTAAIRSMKDYWFDVAILPSSSG